MKKSRKYDFKHGSKQATETLILKNCFEISEISLDWLIGWMIVWYLEKWDQVINIRIVHTEKWTTTKRCGQHNKITNHKGVRNYRDAVIENRKDQMQDLNERNAWTIIRLYKMCKNFDEHESWAKKLCDKHR